jgi:hypothetical protein
MMQRQMLGIRERAERLAREGGALPAGGVAVPTMAEPAAEPVASPDADPVAASMGMP